MRHIKHWATEHQSIAESIRRRTSYFKVVLKTKNEATFLSKWLRHYLTFLPPEAIIIFDNMSTDAEVIACYNNLPAEIVIAQYDGFHNFLHVVNAFPELYDCLAESSTYFGLFDTDEFLVHIDGSLTPQTFTVIPFLQTWEPMAAFPCCWLTNMTGSEMFFECGRNASVLQGGLQWGKPIVRSKLTHEGIIHHNSQLDKDLPMAPAPTELFLLHMKNLDSNQRIRANLEKLISRKAVPASADVEYAKSLDLTNVEDPIVALYVKELHSLTSNMHKASPILAPGFVSLSLGSQLAFYGELERRVFEDFLR